MPFVCTTVRIVGPTGRGARGTMAYDVLAGVKVVEVAAWLFAPSCGAILADWGADVLKIETPHNGGDPYRGYFHPGPVNPTIELANRGKRSVALDLSTAGGRDALLRFVADADVFVTSLLPGPRARLRIDVTDIRAVNPSIVYVRASGYGTRGPEAETPGYDAAASWARAGFADFLTPPESPQPIAPPGGIGDCVGGLTGAGAVAAALYKRATTGEAGDVDVSLLHSGMWMNATILMMHANAGPDGSQMRRMDRRASPNPLVNSYKTKDGRWLWMVVIQPDPHWRSFCEHVGRPDLVDDERFADFHARMEHNTALIEILDDVFASATVDEWRGRVGTVSRGWGGKPTPPRGGGDPPAPPDPFLPAGGGPR